MHSEGTRRFRLADVDAVFIRKDPPFDRSYLYATLMLERARKCPVIVAKLDRLSRDVAFIAGLMAQRVPLLSPNLAWMRTHSCCTSTLHWLKRSGG